MRTTLFTLMTASLFLAHCGKENESDGGSWSESPEQAKAEEKGEPAKPATSNADNKKDGPSATPPKAETSPKSSENSGDAKTGATETEYKPEVRITPEIPMEPGWELVGPDDHGAEWRLRVTYVSTKFAIVKLEKNYSTVIPSKKLESLGQRSSLKTKQLLSVFSWVELGRITDTKIEFIRSEDTGECSAIYKVDGTFSSTNVTMYGSCP